MPSRDELMSGTIAVLLGGKSAEREISLKTGAAVERALLARGYQVRTIDPVDDLAARLLESRPKAAFVALHGRFGEDGSVQGLLECFGIPYTGSGVLASALAMDKVLTKRVLAASGIPTPDFAVLESTAEPPFELSIEPPVVVKPAKEGSSVGIALVFEESQLEPAIKAALDLGGPALIERYVKGKELSVAILEGRSLGAIEIAPARDFYDYEAKYAADSGTRYIYPASISKDLQEELGSLASLAFSTLGCAGVCRADFMVDQHDRPWFIEINTLPGMTETSLVPKIAAGLGISFEELCERLLLSARLWA